MHVNRELRDPGNDKNFDLDQVNAVLQAIYIKYGYDFTKYSPTHISRRIRNRMSISRVTDLRRVREMVLTDEEFAGRLFQDLSITVTEMFRDPDFYKALREKVIPILRTYPFIRIWHAGCATGAEVYSMAILLQEEGLYERATLYATDFNQVALDEAREGIFTTDAIKRYTTNYQKAGGTRPFSDYYSSSYDKVIMNSGLKRNIVWAHHNLATDSVFAEVHVVLCRNVLIYFNKDLQNRSQQLFYDSLTHGGVLCLGTKESLRFTSLGASYAVLDGKQSIYKKKY